jgi:hypothetical protein
MRVGPCKINWGRRLPVKRVTAVQLGDEYEGRIKFVDFGRSARRMCQQLSPTRKGHHGSRSAK